MTQLVYKVGEAMSRPRVLSKPHAWDDRRDTPLICCLDDASASPTTPQDTGSAAAKRFLDFIGGEYPERGEPV